jgi:hypothetical protein
VLVEPTTCKSGAPTLDGSKSLSMMMANSLTGLTTRDLMLEEVKTLKEIQLVSGVTMEVQLKNGKFFILTKQLRPRQRDLMQNSVSTSTDHSILFHNFHSIELLKCLVELIWF